MWHESQWVQQCSHSDVTSSRQKCQRLATVLSSRHRNQWFMWVESIIACHCHVAAPLDSFMSLLFNSDSENWRDKLTAFLHIKIYTFKHWFDEILTFIDVSRAFLFMCMNNHGAFCDWFIKQYFLQSSIVAKFLLHPPDFFASKLHFFWQKSKP